MCEQTLGDRALYFKNVFLQSFLFVLIIMICCKGVDKSVCFFSVLVIWVFIEYVVTYFKSILENQ